MKNKDHEETSKDFYWQIGIKWAPGLERDERKRRIAELELIVENYKGTGTVTIPYQYPALKDDKMDFSFGFNERKKYEAEKFFENLVYARFISQVKWYHPPQAKPQISPPFPKMANS